MSKTLEQLGFYKYLDNESTLLYKLDGETNKYSITFDKKLKRYHVCWEMFIPNDSKTWSAQEFETEWLKYCASQGHWQSECIIDIDMELHNAITNECKKLGWLYVK